MAQKKWLNFSDYQQALQKTLQDTPNVIIVEGEEEYLRHAAIESIQQKLKKDCPTIAQAQFFGPAVQGEGNFNFSELLMELTSSSLFSSKKIISFRRAQRSLFIAGSKETAPKRVSPLESLANYIKSPSNDNFLIIEVEKINRQRIIGKAMAKESIIPCPLLNRQRDIIAWMKNIAKNNNKSLASDAAITLHRAHGGDLGILASEIEKLALYIGDEHLIDDEAAKVFLSGSVEFSIFELTNSLEQRNLAKALNYSRLICEQGSRDRNGKRQDGQSSAHQAMALIASLIENLTQARAMLSEQLPANQIIAELGMHPKRAENIMQAANNFTLTELQHILQTLADEMRSSHDTGADTKLSLDRIAVAICQKKKHISI